MTGCDACGFGALPRSRVAVLGTLRKLTAMWRGMAAPLDGEDADRLLADRIAGAADRLEEAGGAARSALAAPAPGDQGQLPLVAAATSAASAITRLDRAVAALYAPANRAPTGDWDGAGGAGLAALITPVVHDAVHRVHDAGRLVHASGLGAPRHTGRVEQLNVSAGGVPKSPVESVVVDAGGLHGDHQAERRLHGLPFQAVSLWSSEIISTLRHQGHSLVAGAAGENVTVTGLDWPLLRPGVRLAVGGALLEVADYATPCHKNARWFSDGVFGRIDQARNPGTSRLYAWVLGAAEVRSGDPVVVEP